MEGIYPFWGGDGVTKSEVLLVLRFVVLGVGFLMKLWLTKFEVTRWD